MRDSLTGNDTPSCLCGEVLLKAGQREGQNWSLEEHYWHQDAAWERLQRRVSREPRKVPHREEKQIKQHLNT